MVAKRRSCRHHCSTKQMQPGNMPKLAPTMEEGHFHVDKKGAKSLHGRNPREIDTVKRHEMQALAMACCVRFDSDGESPARPVIVIGEADEDIRHSDEEQLPRLPNQRNP